jgi:hypothetical protein
MGHDVQNEAQRESDTRAGRLFLPAHGELKCTCMIARRSAIRLLIQVEG